MGEGEEVAKVPTITMELAMKVIGTLATLLLGITMWVVQTNIEDTRALQRQVDLHIANIVPRVEQGEDERKNLWIMKNKETDEKLSNNNTKGLLYVDLMVKVMVIESNQERIMKKIGD